MLRRFHYACIMQGNMEDLYSVKNKIAVVTGGCTGIGKAIATRLASLGALVVIADINLDAAKKAAEDLPSTDADFQKHSAIYIDVSNEAVVTAAYEEIGAKYGRIDIAINNAGVSTMNRMEDITEKEWDFNMDVNAKGIFLCTKHEIPFMKEHGGVMVNTCSMAALLPAPLLAHYNASKYAVLGWTLTAAKELAKYNIRVNCVCPGFVFTDMQNREVVWEGELRGLKPEEVRDEYIRLTPLGRLCMPDDVAKAVAFLVSPQADFLTGIAIPVTGGADI